MSQLNEGNRVQKVLKPFKNLASKAKENPIVAIPAAILAVLLVGGVVAFAVLSGGGDGDDSTIAEPDDSTTKKDPAIEEARKRKVKPAPVLSGSGTLDTARSVGTYAVAQGRGRIKNPSAISVRVSAAPKQRVTVDYQLSCYRQSGTKVGTGGYTTRPPDVRNIPLPIAGAKECIATVGAQLTSSKPGRVKVAIISG